VVQNPIYFDEKRMVSNQFNALIWHCSWHFECGYVGF